MKSDFTGWLTVALLLGTFIIEFLQYKKRIKISVRPQEDPRKYSIVPTNSGLRDIILATFGFKKWNGQIVEEKWPVVNSKGVSDTLATQRSEHRALNQGQTLNLSEVYYFFVKDSTGHVTKKYRHWVIVSWLIRAWNILKG